VDPGRDPKRRLGFWHIAADEPERPALLIPAGESWSFGELLAAANRLAHGFRARGLEPGDGLAALLPNCASYYALHLAAMQSGLYLTPVNSHLSGSEIAYILDNSDSRLLVAHERFATAALSAAREAGLDEDARFVVGAAPGFRPFDELHAGQPETRPERRRAGQVMLYTAGTTGRPKGVRRPLPDADPDDVAERSTVFARAFDLRPLDGVNLVVGPLYHAGPSVYSWGSLHVGHLQVVTERFDAEQVLALIERHRVTNSCLVATMFHRLLALPEETKQRYDLSSLRMVAHSAAPTPVEVKRRMMEWWGPVIWETYGGSEGAATIAKPQRWLEKPGTVGRAVRGVKLLILDDEDKPCPPGAPGRVYLEIKGSRFEYWKDPEKTQNVHRGRTFTLGDVGYLDEDGYLFLTGRQSDVIISGGVNIYPAEVEAVLLAHPNVADAAVIGTPDEEWGEQVRAVVQPAEAIQADAVLGEELIDFCRARLAHYKCPRAIDFRRELPRQENGKLYKRVIRDEYWREAGRSI
jgi:long-chain acyl-CoA synthetase